MKRAIRIREKEHRDAVRPGHCTKSAVAEHVHSSVVPHEVDWSSLQVLDRAGRKMERKIREAFHIYKPKPVMNRDTGVERSQTWNAILESLVSVWEGYLAFGKEFRDCFWRDANVCVILSAYKRPRFFVLRVMN